MAAYQQMGHHSAILLFEEELSQYAGAILSPVNNTPEQIGDLVARCNQELHDKDILFDPQLYCPNTERGVLDRWTYFPQDVDTADLSSLNWWGRLVDQLQEEVVAYQIDGICSPVALPRVYSDEFYATSVEVAHMLKSNLEGEGIRTLQTAIVSLNDMATPDRSLAVASLLTRGDLDEIYLIGVGEQEPRRELSDTEGLKGFMRLIAALEDAGVRVLVGYSSSDMLLWKAAGATACATGKFFNLRRFTSARFEEPPEGGGQLPYWFEESLVAFLREPDVIRVRDRSLLSVASMSSPFYEQIMERIVQQRAWLALSWRQFMRWFVDADLRFGAGELDVRSTLRNAEVLWRQLEDEDLLMEEVRNDGSWLRPWRRALAEFSAR